MIDLLLVVWWCAGGRGEDRGGGEDRGEDRGRVG